MRVSATVRPSGSTWPPPSKSTRGMMRVVRTVANLVKTRRVFARARSASSTSPTCVILTATSFADFTGRRSDAGDRQRKQVARGATACREACVGGDVHGDDILDFPSAAGGARREAAGGLVFVGAHLHARQRHREGRVSRGVRGARADIRCARYEPTRRECARRGGI